MRFFCLAVLLLVSCRTIPEKTEQPPEGHAEAPVPGTRLALLEEAVLSRQRSTTDGATGDGFLPITRNGDHLQWFLALVDTAEQTLDMQYYLWGDDPAGSIAIDRVLQAADRGVRVRMVVDDFLVGGRDRGLASLDLHPNIEVRIFNPWRSRNTFVRAFEYGFSDRIKMRMHNKLIVADNRFCLVGGRNVAAEYYGLSNEFNFQDMGLLACGPITRKASQKFDLYWNAQKIYPAALLSKKGSLEYLEKRRAVFRERVAMAPVLAEYPRERADGSAWLDRLPDEMVGGNGAIVGDRPQRDRTEEDHSIHQLELLLKDVGKDAMFVHAYFVPTQRVIDELTRFVKSGARVRILTNSLASNDVAMVNSGYRRWRKKLIEAGVELHELRHDAAIKKYAETSPAKGKYLALHAKTMVFDRRSVYIGSLNITPRTMDLRSLENGILVRDCPALAEPVAKFLDQLFKPENSWRVGLDEKGKLYWESSAGRVTKQPVRSSGQRFSDWFWGLFPLENQM